MSLPLSCSASRLMPLPNADAGYSNTGLRRPSGNSPKCLSGYVYCYALLSAARYGQGHA